MMFLIMTYRPLLMWGRRKESSEPFCDLGSLILYAGVERSCMGGKFSQMGDLSRPRDGIKRVL